MTDTVTGYSRLHVGPVEELRVSVVPHPGATLLSLVADALGGRSQGVPAQWRGLVRAAAPHDAVRVLRPLFAPRYSVIPDCLTPTATTPATGPGGAARTALPEQLADLPPPLLLEELETEFGGAVPPQWRPVVERPADWLHAYARLMVAVWQAFAPVWSDAGRLLDREAERVGAALVGRRLDAVLLGISSRTRFAGDALFLPDQQPGHFDLADRRLTLVPIVSGTAASVFCFDRPDLAWIGYPVPGIGRLWTGRGGRPPPDGADALALTLGEARAAVLRALGGPLTMGELSAEVGCSPATATYHCDRLETAGLLVRERRGRRVRLTRTDRGDSLVDLLS